MMNYDAAWLTIADPTERFWTFYRANAKDAEKILWAASWKFHGNMEPAEIYNELILRLHRSNFLKDFNPELAQFGTFFVGRAEGYAKHILTRLIKESSRKPMISISDIESTDEDSYGGYTPTELVTQPDCEGKVSCTEVMNIAEQSLTDFQKNVWRMTVEDGYNEKEISEKLSTPDNTVTKNYVHSNMDKTKRVIVKVCTKNGLVAEPKETVVRKVKVEKAFKEVKAEIASKDTGKNGHAKEATRSLTDQEKQMVRLAFVKANGVIPEDFCLRIKENLGPLVSIFQVTGIVASLHRQVAKGQLQLKNMEAYQTSIEAHRKSWAAYKSERYQKRYGSIASVAA